MSGEGTDPIAIYLQELGRRLRLNWRARRRVLEEVRVHLTETSMPIQASGMARHRADTQAIQDFGEVEQVAQGFDPLGRRRAAWYWRAVLGAFLLLAVAAAPSFVRLPHDPAVPIAGSQITVAWVPRMSVCAAAWDRPQNAPLRDLVAAGGPFPVAAQHGDTGAGGPSALASLAFGYDWIAPGYGAGPAPDGCTVVATYGSTTPRSGKSTTHLVVFRRSRNTRQFFLQREQPGSDPLPFGFSPTVTLTTQPLIAAGQVVWLATRSAKPTTLHVTPVGPAAIQVGYHDTCLTLAAATGRPTRITPWPPMKLPAPVAKVIAHRTYARQHLIHWCVNHYALRYYGATKRRASPIYTALTLTTISDRPQLRVCARLYWIRPSRWGEQWGFALMPAC